MPLRDHNLAVLPRFSTYRGWRLMTAAGADAARVRIHDPAHFAYSIYAGATTLRRDNLRRSADELRAHLAKAEKALRELGEVT